MKRLALSALALVLTLSLAAALWLHRMDTERERRQANSAVQNAVMQRLTHTMVDAERAALTGDYKPWHDVPTHDAVEAEVRAEIEGLDTQAALQRLSNAN